MFNVPNGKAPKQNGKKSVAWAIRETGLKAETLFEAAYREEFKILDRQQMLAGLDRYRTERAAGRYWVPDWMEKYFVKVREEGRLRREQKASSMKPRMAHPSIAVRGC